MRWLSRLMGFRLWFTAWFGGGAAAAFSLYRPNLGWPLAIVALLLLATTVAGEILHEWSAKKKLKKKKAHAIACDFCRARNFVDEYPAHQHIPGNLNA
jgi:hypothetical protein